MQLQINLIPGAIGDLYADVSTSGYITLADRYGLMAVILEETLSPDEECFDTLRSKETQILASDRPKSNPNGRCQNASSKST
jgi:hypothetical protein